jgi:hypothetical protein
MSDGTLSVTTPNPGLAQNYTLGNPNQTVTGAITPKPLTVAVTNNLVTKVYDSKNTAPVNFTPILNWTGLLSGDTVASKYTDAVFNDASVSLANQVVINGLQLDSITGTRASVPSDYQLPSTPLTVAATITAKNLTASGITASTKTYDQSVIAPLNTASASVTGGATSSTDGRYYSGDIVALDVSQATGTFSDANVGDAKSVTVGNVTLTQTDAANYKLLPITTTGNIQVKRTADPVYSSETMAITPAKEPFSATATAPIAPVALVSAESVQKRVSSNGPPLPVLAYVAAASADEQTTAKLNGPGAGTPPKAFNQWTNAQVQSLPAAQVAALEAPQIKQVIRLLDAETQIRAINPQVMPQLDLQTLSGLSNQQINALTPAQLTRMTKAQIKFLRAALSPAQIDALN